MARHPPDESTHDLARDVGEESAVDEAERNEAETGDELEDGALARRDQGSTVLVDGAVRVSGGVAEGVADPIARRRSSLDVGSGFGQPSRPGLERAITLRRRVVAVRRRAAAGMDAL